MRNLVSSLAAAPAAVRGRTLVVLAIAVSLALTVLPVRVARAQAIYTKRLLIKENANPLKRKLLVQSVDPNVQFSAANDPATNGGWLHAYSATDDLCIVLPPGPEWSTNGKLWKYKSKATKSNVVMGDGTLKIKIKSGVTYTLADDGMQGVVNLLVNFGFGGATYCITCHSSGIRDDARQFDAQYCAEGTCYSEPPLICPPSS